MGVLVSLLLPWHLVWAQSSAEEELSFYELENLLDEVVTVASIKPLTLRESPGIVTRITAEQIQHSGARDLIDVLRLVPGFDFGVDVQGVVGVGMRGNWANEGKVLLLIDGLEYNERLYSTLQFGHHFPVDFIQSIEIIRGPGSPLYGGYAELAVINITTKRATDLNGLFLTGVYGSTTNTTARRQVSLAYGRVFDHLHLSASIFGGEGIRSDRTYTDFYEQTYDMTHNSDLNPMNVSLSLGYKGFSARWVMDKYHTTQRDAFDEAVVDDIVYPQPPFIDFDSYFGEIKYTYHWGEHLTLTPQIDFKRQYSWFNDEVAPDDYLFLDTHVDQIKTKLVASYDINPQTNLIVGGEFFNEKAVVGDKTLPENYYDGKKEVDYNNIALLSQLLINRDWFNLTLGARYDDHDAYGNSFVPRIALTHTRKRFHIKALVSAAFRAPAIEHVRTNQIGIAEGAIHKKIDTENTSVYEVELGYQLSDNNAVVANVYHTKIKDPIVYVYDEVFDIEYYLNFEESGTQGIEVEYKYRNNRGYANLTYSFYQVAYDKVPDYQVPGEDQLHLAFPAHKFTASTHLKLNDHISLNPSVVAMSKRYGYAPDQYESPMLKKYEPIMLFHLYLQASDLLYDGLDVGLGIYNLLDEKNVYLQPYDGFHAPLPDMSREFSVKVSYSITLD